MDKYQIYKEYQKKKELQNPGYDCGEIAEDLHTIFGEGEVIYIDNGGGGTQWFKVIEEGRRVDCLYHEVYTDGNYVYDPRYKKEPINKREYLEELKEVNKGNTLNITYR